MDDRGRPARKSPSRATTLPDSDGSRDTSQPGRRLIASAGRTAAHRRIRSTTPVTAARSGSPRS